MFAQGAGHALNRWRKTEKETGKVSERGRDGKRDGGERERERERERR